MRPTPICDLAGATHPVGQEGPGRSATTRWSVGAEAVRNYLVAPAAAGTLIIVLGDASPARATGPVGALAASVVIAVA
jgi:hypothetical protein